jgi:3-methylcrotonyl-CoA carboxylase alpha subunit
MEMNTRLQVEHPVTEAITGMDLVEMQLRVAAGEPLGFTQAELTVTGHAVEVRLYAENPSKKFLPSTGKLACFAIPDSIRVDTGVRAGDEVSMHYDPMLAKLIAHGPDRPAAIAKLTEALKGATVAGVDHNLGYLAGVLEHDAFIAGDYTTQLAELVHEEVVPRQASAFAILASLFVLASRTGDDPWAASDGFRNNLPTRQRVLLRQGKKELVIDIATEQANVDGQSVALSSHHEQFKAAQDGMLATVSARIDGQNFNARVLCQGAMLYVMCGGHTEKFIEQTDDLSRYASQSLSHGGVVSPMPGQVIAMNVKVGDKVKQGDVLAVVEAMKMEHSITAPKAGTITQVTCGVGDRVDEGFELVVF